jgi:predicted AlkP superfamily phosphohydrolase/phosphomutase
MRILVIGLDCAAPEILLQDSRLVHIRRLMEVGCYGRLESVVPPITVPAWMCMATSQDPGTLGVYGFRNRVDHGYGEMGLANSKNVRGLTIWDQFACEGRRSVVVAVPPNYPPRRVNGVSVGCFLTPDSAGAAFTHPEDYGREIRQLVGDYPVDVRGFRTPDKAWLKDEILTMTEKHFTVVRHLLKRTEWDYFQFVEIGLDRIQHGFWKHHDPEHRHHDPQSPYGSLVRDYYALLDVEIGRLLELLDEETGVLVLSDHGAQRLDGGFCVNQWLIEQGDLCLSARPEGVTRFTTQSVDWSRTRAWSEGGYYARVFLNVKGREPQGTIDPHDYEKVRSELKQRLETTVDEQGRPLGTVAFRPEEIYRTVQGVAPDLVVHFGGLLWRSIGGVGYPSLHIQENDTGPDDCNHAQFGAFVLAAPGYPPLGQLDGIHLLDMAPTLADLAGCDGPSTMQGRSILETSAAASLGSGILTADQEQIIRQRLSGLGYI